MPLKELQVLCDRKFDLGMYTPALAFLLRKNVTCGAFLMSNLTLEVLLIKNILKQSVIWGDLFNISCHSREQCMKQYMMSDTMN